MNHSSADLAGPFVSDREMLGERLRPSFGKLAYFVFYLIVFTVPYYRYRIPFPQYPFFKIDYVLGVILILLMIPRIILDKRFPATLHSNLWPGLLLFYVINIVSAFYTPYPATSIYGIRMLTISGVYIAFILIFVDEKGFFKTMPAVLIVSLSIATFISALGFFLKLPGLYVGIGQGFYRGYGPTIGANNMALMCNFTFPLLVHFFLYEENFFRRTMILLALVSVLLGFVASYSRGGFLVFLATSLFIFAENIHHLKVRNFGLFLGTIGVIILFGISFVPKSYYQRQLSITHGVKQADISVRRRHDYIIVAIHSIRKHPLLGTGPYTFLDVWVHSIYTRKYEMIKRPAHNTYLEVLVGSGFLGFAVFMFLLWRAFKNYTKAKHFFLERGDRRAASLIGAYRAAYLSILVYFFMKSALHHKYFLIGFAMSEIALRVMKRVQNESEEANA